MESMTAVFDAIKQALVDWKLPGVVVGITDSERLLGTVVHGYADWKRREPLTVDSRFAIGSISKSFTALGLMQVAAEGRLDLHAPLPRLSVCSAYPEITAHHLLTHTSGLPAYMTHAASSRYVYFALRDFAPSYAPGAHFWYSNTGYQILGDLLEDLDGLPYPQAMLRRVLGPLGMSATTSVIDDAERSGLVTSYFRWPIEGDYVEAPWFEYSAGDGSLVSNVRDMCAYARCILKRGAPLLSETDFALWTQPVLDDYAYGLFVKNNVIGHEGAIGGFHSLLEVRLEDGLGIVMLSNSPVPDAFRKWIVRAFHESAPAAAPAPPALLDVGAFTGQYGPALEFVVQEGRLWSKEGDRLSPLEQMGADCYRSAGLAANALPYIFGRSHDDADRAVVGVSHGAVWHAKVGCGTESAPEPPEIYRAYVGHFDSGGPEGPVARVFVRQGQLYALVGGPALPQCAAAKPSLLEPIDAAVFRLGDRSHSPERVRFDSFMDGRAQRMSLSGVPLFRRVTP